VQFDYAFIYLIKVILFYCIAILNLFIGFGEGLANSNPLSRRRTVASSVHQEHHDPVNDVHETVTNHHKSSQWKRIVLLIIAITVHNIPGECNDQTVIQKSP
jgi:zinc transporter ZupT